MSGIIVPLLVAFAVAFISMYPRPKSWAEKAGESLKDWIDERNGWK